MKICKAITERPSSAGAVREHTVYRGEGGQLRAFHGRIQGRGGDEEVTGSKGDPGPGHALTRPQRPRDRVL